MKIVNAVFESSLFDPGEYPAGNRSEIAFIGRSNVGKSTLLNFLLGRKKLARTSSTPGKTQRLNFYLINDGFYLVDLPGYGFTRAPETINRTWRQAIDSYFKLSANLKTVMQLVDMRHDPTVLDRNVSIWLREAELLGGTLAVKSDKISKSKRSQHLSNIQKKLELPLDSPLIMVSSIEKIGKDEIWGLISQFL